MSKRPLCTKAGMPAIASTIRWMLGRTRWGRRRPAQWPLGVRGPHEVEQVGALGLVELEGAAHGVEHVVGHAAGVAALEARVVLDADARQARPPRAEGRPPGASGHRSGDQSAPASA
jgi:hypothetical protein